MPLYRFHVFNDDHTIDAEGKDFADLDGARAYAIQAARSIMGEELQIRGAIDLSDWIEIEDEKGDMTVVTFGDAVTITSSRAASALK